MNFNKIEAKWQKKWSSKKLFETNPENKKKFFTSIIIPYVNGSAHLGHSYTYCRTDAYARFKRMCGYNVLLAQGFHATGEAFLGSIQRLKDGDQLQIDTFKMFGASDADIKKFIQNPEYAARFWMERFMHDMNSFGISVDWRRTFITIDPTFNRFIEWQYNILKKKGYVVQGTHPVVWCPRCQSPAGDHDRLKGSGESTVEYIILKFKFDDFVLPVATLRPETIYGVTNLWLNPDSEYVKVLVNNEKWIISSLAVNKLSDQIKTVKIIGNVSTQELFGKRCIDPISGRNIPILPAEFVDSCIATGIVMSVPAHAPYDFVATRDLQNLERYGISIHELEPIQVVQSELSENAIVNMCKSLNLKDVVGLDNATSTIYKKEFHTGKLKDNCGEYSGSKVNEVKDHIVKDFSERGISDIMHEVNGVVCKCGSDCHVKILEDQWFLKYSDEKWKDSVRQCLKNMEIYPEEARNNFEETIGWLKDKACVRKSGLGTKLPWDKEWIIETLSDSTIYMSYYTIAHIIRKEKIKPENLTSEVFDHVFLNKHNLADVARKSKIKASIIKAMKKEFMYFYPVDFRNSAKDLVQNHLTFYLFHHTAIWPKKYWPTTIAVNGFVNVEGEKMSKSLGNFSTLMDVIKNYGADLTRINIMAAAEGIEDPSWRVESLKSYRSRIESLSRIVKDLKKLKGNRIANPELYLQSKIQKIIIQTTENYENTKFRTGVNSALFESTNELKWYTRRTGLKGNRTVVLSALRDVVRLLAPIIPHTSEELWSSIGKGFVSVEEWPEAKGNLINEDAEHGEQILKQILEDVEHIKKISGIKPCYVKVFIADNWKFDIYNKVLKSKKPIREMMREIGTVDPKATVDFLQSLYKRSLNPILTKQKYIDLLTESTKWLEDELSCKVEIVVGSDHPKSMKAQPDRPGILLE